MGRKKSKETSSELPPTDTDHVEKITWKVESFKVARGRVTKIDDAFVYFEGERGRLIIPKANVVEIK